MWGERHVLHLGAHFDIYSMTAPASWGLTSSIGTPPPGSLPVNMQIADHKLPGSSISGNFGEVLTVFCLESLSRRPLQIGHLRANVANKSAPDLMIETTPLAHHFQKLGIPYPIPSIIPAECKNSEFTSALRQICKYWVQATTGSSTFGFGLISNISYRYRSVKTPQVTFYLLAPVSTSALATLLASHPPDDLRRDDFKGCLYGF